MKPTLSQFGRPLIQKHLRAFLKERNGVLKNKDLEYLHRMRIATRRLRIALWINKDVFSLTDYRLFRKQVRLVTRALGRARDLDTYIAHLKSLLQTHADKPTKAFLNTCLKKAAAKRATFQKVVRLALLRFEQCRIGDKLLLAAKNFSQTDEPEMAKVIQKKVQRCLKDLFEFSSDIHHFKNQTELHALRIAAKHLRYTLESLNSLYHGKLDQFVEEAVKIQGHLGDMRNQLVWKDEFKRARSLKTKNSFLSDLINECDQEAQNSFKEFLHTWKHQEQSKIWKKLQKIL